MNKSIKVGIIALFVLLSVGFAAVAANLIVNGNANIASLTLHNMSTISRHYKC